MTSDFPADALTPVTRTELRPAYVQIASQIRRIVAERGVESGVKLPVESELVERFGVSRMTVREGLRVLRLEGLLRAEHGVGVFVDGDGGKQTPTQIGGAVTPSEAAWREAVVAALHSPDRVGAVGELEEIWASSIVGVEARAITRIDVQVSDQPGRQEVVRLYLPSSLDYAATAARSAIESAVSWLVSVRGAGQGDMGRNAGDLVVTRTAFDDAGSVLLAAQGHRSSNWAVTLIETL